MCLDFLAEKSYARGRGRLLTTLAAAGLLALASALLPVASPAAETPPPSLDEMDLEQLMDLKVDTVYGASLYAQTTSEAPSSVTIISSEQIKRFGWRTLAEILAAVRSFYLTDDRVYTYLGVRGLQRPGDYNSRVLVLLDGHTTNDNLFGSAAFGRDAIVDVALIDRVEVIRGPGSSLYGTGAFFGVVSIITRTGKDIAAAEVQAGAGSLETYEGRLSVGRRFGNGVDVVLSGSRYQSAGAARYYLAAFDDPATNDGIAADADGEGAGSLFLRLSRGGFTLEGAFSDRERTSPSAPYGTVFNTDRTRGEDARAFLELRYEGKVAEHADLSARVFYDTYRFRGDYLYDYAAAGEEPLPTVNRDEADGAWWGAESHAVVVAGAHTITGGATIERHVRQDQKNFDVEPFLSYFEDERDSLNWGAFLQEQLRLGKKVSVTLGARYDWYETFGGSLNPRLALVWMPRESTDVKLLYGTAFRAPNNYELYYAAGEIYKQNPEIDPERISTYEAVLEQRLGSVWRFTVDGFHYRIRDVIELVEDPEDGKFLYDNTGGITATGAEIELAGKWAGGLQASASYSYQIVREDATDETAVNSPQHLAKARILAPLIADTLVLSAEARYQSARKTAGGGEVGGSTVVDATLSTGPALFKWVELTASVRNLLDTSYDDPTADDFEADRVPQTGRTFRAGATVRF